MEEIWIVVALMHQVPDSECLVRYAVLPVYVSFQMAAVMHPSSQDATPPAV